CYKSGKGIDELTRVHGISRATLYKWRQRYRGMDASEMKHMYANLAMELDVAKYIIEKSSKALREKDHHLCSPPRAAKDIGKACRLLRLSRVIWVLKHLVNRYGKPENIRMDNGPEFIAKIAKNWSKTNGETHSKRLSG